MIDLTLGCVAVCLTIILIFLLCVIAYNAFKHPEYFD